MEKQTYEPLNGIYPIENEETLKLVEKVIEKIVRVEVSDGRIYLGLLMSCD